MLTTGNPVQTVIDVDLHQVLESIYEPLFLPGSYGFRPGRSCHNAIRDLLDHLYRNPVQTVIAKFFDTIDHELLLGMLREKINDPKCLRLRAADVQIRGTGGRGTDGR